MIEKQFVPIRNAHLTTAIIGGLQTPANRRLCNGRKLPRFLGRVYLIGGSPITPMWIVMVLCFIFAIPITVCGNEPIPPNVREALDRNTSIFSDRLISGEKSLRPLAPIHDVLNALKTTESEADFTKMLGFELRFRGPLFRESIEYPPGTAFTNNAVYEVAFDGTRFVHGYKELKNLADSTVYIFTPAIAAAIVNLPDHQNLETMQFWYLHETGFNGPDTISALGQPVFSTILAAAEQGNVVSVKQVSGEDQQILEVIIEQPEPWQSRETFDIETHEPYLELTGGTDVLQMRMERERRQLVGKHRLIRFLLNSSLGYAVEEKWEIRKESGDTLFYTKNSDFVEVAPGGVWMPRRCVVDSHAYYTVPLFVSPEPLFQAVIHMDQCKPGNFKDDDFRVWYDEPGALVVDYTSPNATLEQADQYRVPASVDDLPKNFSGFRRWLITLNILLILGWLGWWCFVRSRTRSTGS